MRMVVTGRGVGPLLVLGEPLSFWGGVDPESGDIVDVHHPDAGLKVTGALVIMPHGKGSSSSASVLAECIRLGTAPAGLILGEVDEILVVGAMVANELYATNFPIAVGEAPGSHSDSWVLDRKGLHAG